MNTPRPQRATRLIPTAVGLMYAQATSVGISRLVRAGVGSDDDETGAYPADEADQSPADEPGAEIDRDPENLLTSAPGQSSTEEANRHLDNLAGQLDDYFEGQLRHFTVPVDWAAAGVFDEFAREVYREIQHIPYGETDSYGQISIDAGRPRNARRVGRLCSLVPVSFLIPVHRVTRADGGLGSCPEFRRGLLAHEKRNVDSVEPVAINPA